MKQREDWKRYETEQMQKENEEILKYDPHTLIFPMYIPDQHLCRHAQEKQAQERTRMRTRIAEEEQKEAVRQRLADKLARERAEQEEMDRIRLVCGMY